MTRAGDDEEVRSLRRRFLADLRQLMDQRRATESLSLPDPGPASAPRPAPLPVEQQVNVVQEQRGLLSRLFGRRP